MPLDCWYLCRVLFIRSLEFARSIDSSSFESLSPGDVYPGVSRARSLSIPESCYSLKISSPFAVQDPIFDLIWSKLVYFDTGDVCCRSLVEFSNYSLLPP